MTVKPTRDQLRALADQAARGPWTVDDGGGYDFSVTQGADGDYIASDVTPRDAAFIAAARTAIPQLLDQLDQAEARIRAVQDVLDQAEASINRHPAYTFSGQRMDPIVNGADIRRALDGGA